MRASGPAAIVGVVTTPSLSVTETEPPPSTPVSPPGVAIFAKVCFGHPSPSKQQNLTRPFMPTAPRPSCVRCVITSSRLYTTPQ
ncbi:hypothetical protein [Candidatus Reidiella endopervernicosa]|uniref:Uncharacterized protein n=1 Tax=Candidatus Reidiella endopervernicosa TaxID=2738883 RepID=A0A6N0HSP8_9GAMM|nr:hypothetical protein [Candidatus Reidiella endopervernicosa]QKQ25382.1 hypothetical protein HUE57_03065 [Candidatus Reidiella endopervernicosa]